jgi:hypothetical protein
MYNSYTILMASHMKSIIEWQVFSFGMGYGNVLRILVGMVHGKIIFVFNIDSTKFRLWI